MENEFIRRLSDIEALKYRSENRRIIPSIFESTTEITDMAPFNEQAEYSEDDVKNLMELALISLNKEEALTMCWNSVWFLAAIKDYVDDREKAEDVLTYFRELRRKIINDEIVFE
jgi:hypothetical protein